jgi:hypothetical protein
MDEGGSQPPVDYTFSYGNGNCNHHLGAGLVVHKEMTPAVNRIQLITDRKWYITFRD